MTHPEIKNSQISPEDWVDNYADTLYSYALFRCHDQALAEEFVQETFVAALAARKNFKGDSTEKTWLFAILKNKIIDSLRRKYREKSQPLEEFHEYVHDDFFDERGEWLVKPGKWQDNPQQNFEQREFIGVLQECLTQLPAKQSDAFTLREFEDRGSEEICKVLGVSPTNYWVLMHRARLVIRRCLEGNWFTNSGAGGASHENVGV